jgi:carbonic anhydrase/acetyltransferase-like protein (isoleucine patch superfamily)
VHPTASTNFAAARIELGPGAELKIGADVVTERIPGALRLVLGAGAQVEIGDRTWLRTEIEPIHIAVFAGARLVLGADSWLSGCHLSAKHAILCGRKAWIGNGCRVIDSDQHDLDDATKERGAPITIGDNVWIPADITVLRGVTIGANSVIGARSLVARDVPPHTLAYGFPAVPRGTVGDRTKSP